jgi:hypothetical protein
VPHLRLQLLRVAPQLDLDRREEVAQRMEDILGLAIGTDDAGPLLQTVECQQYG